MDDCDPEEWDAFLERSQQATPFQSSAFLACYDRPARFVLCRKGGEAVAGLSFAAQDDRLEPMPFQAYCGVAVKDHSEQKPITRNVAVAEALGCVAEWLFDSFDRVRLQNHWSLIDYRPFDWLNYHAPEKGVFRREGYFTSLLDLADPSDLSGYESLRRRCLKRAGALGVTTRLSRDVGLLDRLHERTFERQALDRPVNEAALLPRLAERLLALGLAELFVAEYRGRPASAAMFAFDRRRAYYLFGANDPDLRFTQAGTKIMTDAFLWLAKERALAEVDFLGVNSPQRGSFKLSFGGRIEPYFVVKKHVPDRH
jgi:hypothetical protein